MATTHEQLMASVEAAVQRSWQQLASVEGPTIGPEDLAAGEFRRRTSVG